MLLVKTYSFEVRAPQGMRLETRDFIIESSDAAMWLDRIGWAGTPLDRRDCIHVVSSDETGSRIEMALTPESGLEPAWEALIQSGVKAKGS